MRVGICYACCPDLDLVLLLPAPQRLDRIGMLTRSENPGPARPSPARQHAASILSRTTGARPNGGKRRQGAYSASTAHADCLIQHLVVGRYAI